VKLFKFFLLSYFCILFFNNNFIFGSNLFSKIFIGSIGYLFPYFIKNSDFNTEKFNKINPNFEKISNVYNITVSKYFNNQNHEFSEKYGDKMSIAFLLGFTLGTKKIILGTISSFFTGFVINSINKNPNNKDFIDQTKLITENSLKIIREFTNYLIDIQRKNN